MPRRTRPEQPFVDPAAQQFVDPAAQPVVDPGVRLPSDAGTGHNEGRATRPGDRDITAGDTADQRRPGETELRHPETPGSNPDRGRDPGKGFFDLR